MLASQFARLWCIDEQGSVVLAIGYQLLWAWVDRETLKAEANESIDS